ncbi:MAG: isocitrate dehydrogenase [Phycisphaerae bacterium]|nr:isocitrate dehydrogenase [Phycisphaerae bacterium]
MSTQVVLIPGDGIGPEVTSSAVALAEAAGANIEWIRCHAGESALESHDDVLPEETIDQIRSTRIALKGPCTTPLGGGYASVNVQLRKSLNLYAAVRPVRSLPGIHTRYQDVDMVVIRENTEGLYSGIENVITDGVITSLKVATETACTRIAEFAFEYARARGRRKITSLHKANIMKLSDGLFIRCAKEVAAGYTDIEYEELIIDAACMKLVQDPSKFDMVLCENLYGDVVSDLCAGFVGGLGVVPGANIGRDQAVFEAVHGSAPDIAGSNKANPLAVIMSLVMLLNHLASTRSDQAAAAAADRIKAAYNKTLESGSLTMDLGGRLDTTEFTDVLIGNL